MGTPAAQTAEPTRRSPQKRQVALPPAGLMLCIIAMSLSSCGSTPSPAADSTSMPTAKSIASAAVPVAAKPAQSQAPAFNPATYAKKIEQAYIAANAGRPIVDSCDISTPTWQCYYIGVNATSESFVTMTLTFDGGVSDREAKLMAERGRLAFFNFVGADFSKLDTIVTYSGAGLDIGTTFRRDVPLLQRTPAPVAATASEAPLYASCTAVRAAGAAPIHRGDAGYSSKLDRDGNGTGCE